MTFQTFQMIVFAGTIIAGIVITYLIFKIRSTLI